MRSFLRPSSLRPRLPLALIAALLLAVAGLGCGDEQGSGGDSRDAKALLERAFAKRVKSGDLRLDLKADLEGGGDRLEKPIELKLAGPYKLGGRDKLPQLDWDVSFRGLGMDVNGGIVATADNGFLELQGEAYELGAEAFTSLARQYAALQPGTPRSITAFGVDPTSWLDNPRVDEDGGSIGGEPTRKVTASVDVRQVARDVVDLARSPRLRRQLERQGRPVPRLSRLKDEDLDRVEDAIDEFDVEVDVDRNDVVRRLFAEVDFDLPGDEDGDEVKGGRVSLSYVLRKVGTNPVIRAPQNAKPLGQLLDGFGLGGLRGGSHSR